MKVHISYTRAWARLRLAAYLGVAVLLLLLTGLLHSMSTYAQDRANPTLIDVQAAVGGQFLVQGHHFPPDTEFMLKVQARGATTSLGVLTSNPSGVLGPAHFTLPAQLAAGDYFLQATLDVGVVARARLSIQPPPTLQLQPVSGPPGTLVEVTVENLIPGQLRLDIGGVAVLGPVAVRETTFHGQFVMPADGPEIQSAAGSEAAIQIAAVNLVGDFIAGTGQARFTRQALTPSPTYSVREITLAGNNLVAGDSFAISGKLDPPPSGDLTGYKFLPFWENSTGQRIPILAGEQTLDAAGNFQVQARLPTLLRGDAFSAKAEDHLGLQANWPNGQTTITNAVSGLLLDFPHFSVKVVSAEDGHDIPNTPAPQPGEGDPLQVSIEPLGIISLPLSSPLDLSGATPVLDVQAVLGTLKFNQMLPQMKNIIDQIANCTLLVDQAGELKRWEWIVDPWDTIGLSTLQHPMFSPAINAKTAIPGRSAVAAPAAIAGMAAEADPNTLFFVYRVLVDASRVIDGAQKGYGLVDAANYAMPTEATFIWVPQYNLIFAVDPQGLTATQTTNPAPIRMKPLPVGWQSQMVISTFVIPGLEPKPGASGNDRYKFGDVYSFLRAQYNGGLNPAIQFVQVDPLKIIVELANSYSGGTQVEPAVTITLDGTPLTLVKKTKAQEPEKVDGCNSIPVAGQTPDPLQAFYWEASIANPHTLKPPGEYEIVVTATDGHNTTKTQKGTLRYESYPAWFDDMPISNRQVKWQSGGLELSATALDPAKAKTNVKETDEVEGLGSPNSSVNAGSQFTCSINRDGGGLQEQTGVMNSSALDNPASPHNFNELSYCDKDSAIQAVAAVVPSEQSVTGASVMETAGEKITILDTGKIKVFQASYGIPGIATVGIAVDFRIYATSEINSTITSGIDVTFDSGVEVNVYIEADVLLGLASIDFGFSANVGVAIPVGFTWAGGVDDPSKCFHYGLDLFYDIEVAWGLAEVADGRYPIFHGEEADGCYNWPVVSAAARGDKPSNSNPVIATDGFGQTMALWRSEEGNIVYSLYNTGAWSHAQPVIANGKSSDPAIAFYAPGKAIAVWSQSGLATSPGPTILTDQLAGIFSQQHLAYAIWDGSWSAPQNLTVPSTGDGKVALAACPATQAGCPSSGAVTAVWVHDQAGDFTQRQFRIYTAAYQNNAWSAPSAVDAASTAADVDPTVAYVGSVALAAWVRDGDRQITTRDDQRIALRFLNGASAVDVPAALPVGALSPDLAVDSEGNVQMAFAVTDAQDQFISNRRMLHRGKGVCEGGTACTWTAQKLLDGQGRAIFVERPRVTVDGDDQVTLTYRAMGFDPATMPLLPVATQKEPLGILQQTGELAQLELPSALTGSSTPNYLTSDGAVNWRPDAVYVPQLDKIISVAVKGPATNVAIAARTLAATTNERAEPIDLAQPVIFADSPRQPNFVVTDLAASQPAASGAVTVSITLLNAGAGWTDPNGLSVAAFWDDTSWTGEAAGSTSVAELAPGQAIQLSIPLTAPSLNPGAPHSVEVIVNRGQLIPEQTDQDNRAIIAIASLAPPQQVRGSAQPAVRLAFLDWTASTDPRLAGYRIYRMQDGSLAPVGTTTVAGWVDPTVAWAGSYQYVVRSFDADFVESLASDSVTVQVPAQPIRVFDRRLLLPLVRQ